VHEDPEKRGGGGGTKLASIWETVVRYLEKGTGAEKKNKILARASEYQEREEAGGLILYKKTHDLKLNKDSGGCRPTLRYWAQNNRGKKLRGV